MLELRAFAGLVLQGAEFAQPKRLALLAYLAIARPRGLHRRDKLVGYFWPELDDAHARQALRQALTAIRALDDRLVVTRGDEEVGIAPDILACDALAFEQASEREDWDTALNRYAGPFLDGFFLSGCPEFERWVEVERARLNGLAADAAWKLADAERVPAAAVRWARRAAALQPDDEGAVRRLVTMLDAAGDRAGALREHEAFAQRLREQFQAEPAPETQALIATVRQRREAGERREAVRPLPSLGRARRHPAVYPTIVAGSLLTVGALALWHGRGGRDAGMRPIGSIAVLPFADLSPQEAAPYLADGMTEALITELGRVGVFDKVISRTSIMRYRGVSKPAPQIARELGVDALVEASVQRSDGRVRVQARLIHGTTERTLWQDTYQGEFRDVLDLQRDVASAIGDAVRARLGRSSTASLAQQRSVVPAAYEAYLRGIYHISRRTAEDRNQALAELRSAVRLDSLFPAGHARLAYVYAWLGYFGYPGSPPAPAAFAVANAEVKKALELDPSLPEAYLTLAAIRWMHEPDLEASERAVRKALELNPALADAHREYGRLLVIRGRLDAAVREVERARELDPLASARHADVAWVYWLARRYTEAIRLAEEAIALDSSATTSYQALAGSYDALGKTRRSGGCCPAGRAAVRWRAPHAGATGLRVRTGRPDGGRTGNPRPTTGVIPGASGFAVQHRSDLHGPGTTRLSPYVARSRSSRALWYARLSHGQSRLAAAFGRAALPGAAEEGGASVKAPCSS